MQIKNDAVNPKADICKKCIGWCCFRFYMELPAKGNQVDWERTREDVAPEGKAGVDFAEANFIKKYSRPAHGIHLLKGYRRFTLTCKQYDPVESICKAYEDRPPTCRMFVCDPAYHQNRVPDRRDYPAQVGAMRREGIEIKCADGRKTPRRQQTAEEVCDDICAEPDLKEVES